jgi:broad specificity phosphatase PhoE
VRHAEAADRDAQGDLLMCGQLDVPLTLRGQRDAQRLRTAAVGLGRVDAIYTSTLRRAIETARPLARHLRLEPRAWRSLCEISCGLLEGVSLARVKAEHANLWHANLAQDDDNFAWHGGETYRRFRARVLRAVGTIARMHRGGRVIVVTHAGVISQVLGVLNGVPPACWEPYRPATASLTEVWWQEGPVHATARLRGE